MKGRIVKASRVRVRGATIAAGPNSRPPADVPDTRNPQAAIRLRPDPAGGEILEIDCPCGRHLEFRCTYDDGSPPDAGRPEGGIA